MNTFGHIYRLTSFGESHGPAVGGVIDGIPAGNIISLKNIQEALNRRRPGNSPEVSPRKEADRLRVLSGLMALGPADLQNRLQPLSPDTDLAVTLGTPIGFLVENTNARPDAYDHLRDVYRPNHADLTYAMKYHVRDWRGGGRSSGRETVSRVVAGTFASEILRDSGIRVSVEVSQVGDCQDPEMFPSVIEQIRNTGDSVGGTVSGTVSGIPPGLGEPVFAKLQQMLASAMLSIGGVHGFEYGDGFKLAGMTGSESVDIPTTLHGGALTNHCGGILGGISSGNDITFRVAFKPTPSIPRELPTINSNGEQATVRATGRHDPCIAIRGAEVVRGMTWMVLLDAWLMNNTRRTLPIVKR